MYYGNEAASLLFTDLDREVIITKIVDSILTYFQYPFRTVAYISYGISWFVEETDFMYIPLAYKKDNKTNCTLIVFLLSFLWPMYPI
jgi:hypothetical protein